MTAQNPTPKPEGAIRPPAPAAPPPMRRGDGGFVDLYTEEQWKQRFLHMERVMKSICEQVKVGVREND